MLALALSLGPSDPANQEVPYHLHRLSVEDARRLDGRRVRVWLEVGPPAWPTWDVRIVAGVDDQGDGIERSVVLRGEQPDIGPGDRLTVRGRLRLIPHRAGVVNGVRATGGDEIRVEQGK